MTRPQFHFYPLIYAGKDATGNAVEANLSVAIRGTAGFPVAVSEAEIHLAKLGITNVAINCRHEMPSHGGLSGKVPCIHCGELI